MKIWLKVTTLITLLFLMLFLNGCTKTFKVEFFTDGGTSFESVSVSSEELLSKPIKPIKEGFTFIGWYSDVTYNDEYDFTKTVSKDLTLYAKWEINQYDIIFNSYKDYYFSNNVNLIDGEVIESVILGRRFSAVITSENRVFTWGENNSGILGNGTTTDQLSPTEITSQFNLEENEKIISITFASSSALAFTSEGRVFTWGGNGYGILGDGTEEIRLIPTDITSNFILNEGEKIIFAEMADSHAVALTNESRVFTWGYNSNGQIGKSVGHKVLTPIDITSEFSLNEEEKIVSLILGGYHTGAITSEDRVFVWGRNDKGELGDGTTIDRYTPIDITPKFNLNANETIKSLILGNRHTGAITSENKVFIWGRNTYGELGDDSNEFISSPMEITTYFDLEQGEVIESMILGDYHSAVITNENRVYSWGDNREGQVLFGASYTVLDPIDITDSFELKDGETIESIILADMRTSVVTSNNRIFLWGANTFGELGDGTSVSQDSPRLLTGSEYVFETKTFDYGTELENYIPIRAGYTFEGWYLDERLTSEYTFSTMPSSDLVLFAKWEEKSLEDQIMYHIDLFGENYSFTRNETWIWKETLFFSTVNISEDKSMTYDDIQFYLDYQVDLYEFLVEQEFLTKSLQEYGANTISDLLHGYSEIHVEFNDYTLNIFPSFDSKNKSEVSFVIIAENPTDETGKLVSEFDIPNEILDDAFKILDAFPSYPITFMYDFDILNLSVSYNENQTMTLTVQHQEELNFVVTQEMISDVESILNHFPNRDMSCYYRFGDVNLNISYWHENDNMAISLVGEYTINESDLTKSQFGYFKDSEYITRLTILNEVQ